MSDGDEEYLDFLENSAFGKPPPKKKDRDDELRWLKEEIAAEMEYRGDGYGDGR